MATIDRAPSTAPSEARTSAHLAPLDSVLCALDDAACPWCRGLLHLLLDHLETFIPATFGEVR